MSIACPTLASPDAPLRRPPPLRAIATSPDLAAAMAQLPGRNAFAKRRIAARMLDLWQHLHASPAAPATLRELSRISGYSPCHVQRLFKRIFGVAPHAIAAQRKLEYAADLLWSSEDPVDVICRRAGFAHRSSFSRLFKRSYGLSPTDYRAVRDGLHPGIDPLRFRDAGPFQATSSTVVD